MAEHQQLVKLLNDIKTKIDEEDAHEAERFGKLNKHLDQVAEKEAQAMIELEEHEKKRMQELEEHMEEMHKSDCIRIKMLPKALHVPLGAFDSNDDGEIDMAELQHGAELYKAAKDKSKLMTKIAAGMFLLVVILVGVLTGIMITVVESAKESKTASNGVSAPASATPGVKAVSTGAVSEQVTLNSANSDDYFSQLNDLAIAGADGKSFSLKVSGFYRQPCVKCSSGSVVTLITDGGMVDIVNGHVTFLPNDAMLEVDPALADFELWREGAGYIQESGAIGRPADDAGRRKLLATKAQATAAVLLAGNMEPVSTADVATGFDSIDYIKVNAEPDFGDYIKDLQGSNGFHVLGFNAQSSNPYHQGIEVTIPDHMTYRLWLGTSNSIAYSIVPSENLNVFNLPGHYWTGNSAGHFVCSGNGMEDVRQYGGNLDLMGPNSDHMDQTQLVHSTKYGAQIAFMHVFDLGDISAELDTIAAAHPNVIAQIYYEMLFNIEDRKSADFQDTRASVRYTLVVSRPGFAMETNLFSADVDFEDGSMTMSMFGQSLNLPATKRHLLASSNFHDELAAKLGDMFTAIDGLDTIDSTINSAELAETKALKNRYVKFAKRVISRGGDLYTIDGSGAEEMQDYMINSGNAIKIEFMYAIGISSNHFGTPSETPFDAPSERRSVIEAAAASSQAGKQAKKAKDKKKDKKKKKKKL